MNRWIKGLVYGACLGLGSALLGLTSPGAALEENVGLAWLFKVRGSTEPPPDVIVVGLDKRSADALELPPDASDIRNWPRSLHGQLIDLLVERGASLIVFDIAFNRGRLPDQDTVFATAIARSCRTLLLAAVEREADGQAIKEIQPFQSFAEAALAVAPFPLPKEPAKVSQIWAFFLGADHMPTLPVIALHAYALDALEEWHDLIVQAGLPQAERSRQNGHCSATAYDLREHVHTFRHTIKEDPDVAERFAQAFDARREENIFDKKQQRHLRILKALVDLYQGPDSHYLNFYGPPGTIPTVPYQVLVSSGPTTGQKDDGGITGKVVFVGYSERGSPAKDDNFHTVFTKDGIDLSGVEIAATAFANLLNAHVLKPTTPATAAVIVILLGVVLVGVFYLLPVNTAVFLCIFIGITYAIIAHILFNAADLWMPLATPLLIELPLALLVGLLSQYALAQHQRNRMQRAINYYMPPRLAQRLADRPVDPISMKEPVFAACLAADAENFTSLAEGMTPEAAAAYLNSYFEALAEVMSRHQADVTKFHINGAMCAWIAGQPDAAVRAKACLAALAAVEAIDAFNTRCPPLCLEVGVGLHAGSAILGHVGGGGHFEFEIIGDLANTAIRIEEFNKQLGTRVLATEAVVADLDEFLLRPLGAFLFKGKKNPTAVVEIVAAKEQATMAQIALCGRFATALAAFQEHHWQQAAEQFEAILSSHPDDGPSRFYLNNCRSRRRSSRPKP